MNYRIVPVIVLVFLVGCAGFRTGQTQIQFSPQAFTGTEGIRMNFIEGMPPPEVFEEQEFLVGVELLNAGATDIIQGGYTFGLENAFVEPLDDIANVFELPGKSISEAQGSATIITLPVRARSLGEQTETYTSTITATTCYEYATEADLVVCLDPNPTDDPTRQVCQMRPESFAAGQGAPLTVTRVEPRLLSSGTNTKFDFVIRLRNSGRGQVLAPQAAFDGCQPFGLTSESLNVVRMRASLGGRQLTCGKDNGPIKLDGVVQEVRCVLDTPSPTNTAYTAPLRLEIEYGYTETTSTQVRIGNV